MFLSGTFGNFTKFDRLTSQRSKSKKAIISTSTINCPSLRQSIGNRNTTALTELISSRGPMIIRSTFLRQWRPNYDPPFPILDSGPLTCQITCLLPHTLLPNPSLPDQVMVESIHARKGVAHAHTHGAHPTAYPRTLHHYVPI